MFRPLIVALLSITVLVQPALSDTLVLKSGLRHQGTIANRDLVAASPGRTTVVSILPDSTGAAVVRVPVAEIEFVVLEDGGTKRVVDFKILDLPSSNAALVDDYKLSTPSRRPAREAGIMAAVLGAAMVIVGATVKFGGARLSATEGGGLDYDEKSYNAGNYALMIGGGVFAVTGIAIATTAHSSGGKPDGAQVSVSVGF